MLLHPVQEPLHRGAQRVLLCRIKAELDAEAVVRLDVRDIAAQRRALRENDYRFSFDVTGQDGLDLAAAQADVDHAGVAIMTADVAADVDFE